MGLENNIKCGTGIHKSVLNVNPTLMSAKYRDVGLQLAIFFVWLLLRKGPWIFDMTLGKDSTLVAVI